MGCSSCGSGSPGGCGDKGHCSTGGCNKLNTYDWISTLDIHDPSALNLVEVSFKKGARKDFFSNAAYTNAYTGDMVVVSTDSGLDVGKITLSGELVRAQMKKKRYHEDKVSHKVIRRANSRDLEKLSEARALEKNTLVKSRAIARTLDLEMKIGDIEYQGDKRKATIYYTAEGRIDFRELVRSYVKEFNVKIEMRQIGARQESARIGGIGSCGRELCCSTWLSDFKTVTTAAARYQNIAINQSKLSGQCGRLKCCLNYELDSYMDALKGFPKKADYIKTAKGKAALIKTDIFKGLMFYVYVDTPFRSPVVALDIERVKKIQFLNKKGEVPEDLIDHVAAAAALAEEEKNREPEVEFADVTGQIELPYEKGSKRKGGRNKRRKSSNRGPRKPRGESPKKGDGNKGSSDKGSAQKGGANKGPGGKPSGDNQKGGQKPSGNNRNKRRNKNNNRNKGGGPKTDNKGPQA